MTSGSVSGSDRNLFFGYHIPIYINTLSKLLSTVDKKLFRQLLKLAVLDFEGQNLSQEMYLSIKKSNNENGNIDYLYGALHSLLNCALSFPEGTLKKEVFQSDLRELRIQEDYIDDLSNVVYGTRRPAIIKHLDLLMPQFSSLEQMRWRIDVSISTSTLNRVLEPIILIEVKFNNEQKETFEVHPSQFHRLRYAVATLLKEMKNLEAKNILKF